MSLLQPGGSDINAAVERERKRDNGFDRALALVALALVLVGLGIFWASGFRDRISSDAAVTLLLARDILDTGTLLPADWYYGNGDLWIIGPQLFALPFVALWGVTPLALSCGNALGLAVIFASAFALAYAACPRWPTAVLAASPVVALYSHFQREFVAVQLSYGWMSAKLMLLLGAAIVWLRATEKSPARAREIIVLSGYAALLCIWTSENPIRPFLYLVLPLAVALALRRSLTHATTMLAAATAIAIVAGWLLRQWLLGRLLMVAGLDTFHFTPITEWPRHLWLLAAGARHLYGGDALGMPELPVMQQVLGWLRAAIFPAIAILLLARSMAVRTSGDALRWIPLQAGGLDIVIVAGVLVVGTAMVDPVSGRYLIPAWHLALVGFVVAVRATPRWRWIAILLVVAFPLGGVFNAIGIQRAGSSDDAAGLPRPPSLDGVLAKLYDSGFVRGFATHRYANAMTVRSDAHIEACDILFEPQLRPARWVNTKACADPAIYANGFFVLLAADERNESHANTLRAVIGEPSTVIDVEGYSIWAYRKESATLDWLSR